MSKRRGHKAKPKSPHRINAPQGKDTIRFPVDSNGVDPHKVKGTTRESRLPRKGKKAQRGGDAGGLLTSNKPAQVKEDLKLVERAVRSRWNIRRKGMIQRRLLGIVEKPSVTRATLGGPVQDELAADSNAIRASQVLAMMNGQDQTDEHFDAKQVSDQPTTVVNVNQTNYNVDNRRIELARLADKLGARSLSIDGQEVSVAGLARPAVPIPEAEATDG